MEDRSLDHVLKAERLERITALHDGHFLFQMLVNLCSDLVGLGAALVEDRPRIVEMQSCVQHVLRGKILVIPLFRLLIGGVEYNL